MSSNSARPNISGIETAGGASGFGSRSMLRDPALLPIPCFIFAILILLFLNIQTVYEPPLLLPALNGVAFIGASTVAAYLAARGFLSGGAQTLLMLGCGMLAFGLATLSGSLLLSSGDVNAGVTSHNIGALIAGAIHLISASCLFFASASTLSDKLRWRKLLLFYALCLISFGLVVILAVKGIFPSFITQEGATTSLRVSILTLVIVEYLFAAFLFNLHERKMGMLFLRWYWLGLVLIGIGIAGVALGRVGSPMSWTGRLSQSFGQVYILLSLIVAVRSSSVSISSVDWGIGASFRLLELEYKAILDSATDGILIANRQGKAIYGNRQITGTLNVSEDELVGRSIVDLLSPVNLDKRELERRLLDCDQRDLQICSEGENGVCWLLLSSSLIRDGRGEVSSILLTASDTTERKNAEAALQESEERYRNLVAIMPAAVYACDAGGVITFYNQHAAELWGRAPAPGDPEEKFCGSFRLYRNGKPLLHHETPMAEALRTGRPARNEEVVMERPDGSRIIVSVNIDPLYSKTGARSGAINVFVDVTQQKQAELALRESEHRYRDLVQNANSAIMRWKSDGAIAFFNEYAQSFFGYDANEVLGRHIGIILPEKESTGEDLSRLVQDIVKNPERYVQNINENIRRDGSRVWMAWANRPVFDENGAVAEILAVGTDITARKLAEDALRISEERYRQLFENMTEGFALGEPVMASDNAPSDFRFIQVNSAFEKQTGLTREILGRPMTEVLPNLEKQWIDTYCEVALTGNPSRFESYNADLAKHFDVYCYSPTHGRFAILFRDVTRQKEASEALKRSQDEIRRQLGEIEAIYKSAPVGMCVLDGNLRYLRVNDRLAEMNGLSPEEHMGRSVRDVLPELAGHIEEIAARVLQTGEPALNVEISGVTGRTPGAERHWVCHWFPLKSSSGEILGINIVIEETTERKLADEALRKSELRFRLLSDVAGRLLTTMDPQGIVNELCRKVMEHLDCHAFFNFLVDERVGRLHLNACAGIPDEEARRIEWLDFGVAVCGCAARDGERIIAEDIFHTPDIRTELVKSYGIQAYACHPLRVQGKVIGTLSFGTKSRARFSPGDISLMKTVTDQVATAMDRMNLIGKLRESHDELEQRVRERTAELVEANEALRRSEERYRGIFENAPVGIFQSLPEGKYLNLNLAVAQMIGYGSPSELLSAIEDIGAQLYVDPSRREVIVDAAIEAKGPVSFENQYFRKDGSVITANLTIWAVRDGDGAVRYLEGFIEDVTNRKRAEEEIRLYMKRLEESNQALQDFASIASHDLQEPLRKVISFGNMLKRKHGDVLEEGGKDYLNRMLNATERMQSLLKSLLDYSRVTTRAEPFIEINLGEIVAEVLSDLEVRIEKSGGEVILGDLPAIEADPTQMRQLFQNLIGNALKFHKEGERPLVSVRCSASSHGSKEITISDNGIGFDEKHLDAIFAPFQRLHGKSSIYEGTGMGLAICKKIVERHGGSIAAKSSPGEGARFIVTLPVRPLDVAEA